MIPDGEIERVAQQSSTAQICTDNLVDAALAAGGGDNVTVVVVDITDDGRIRELARKHRRVMTLSLIGLLLAIVIIAGVSFISITKSVYLGVKDDAVAIYTGVPGKILGLKLHWLEDETSIKLSDLPEDTQNRLREGIPQKSLENAADAWTTTASKLTSPRPRPSPMRGQSALTRNTVPKGTAQAVPPMPWGRATPPIL